MTGLICLMRNLHSTFSSESIGVVTYFNKGEALMDNQSALIIITGTIALSNIIIIILLARIIKLIKGNKGYNQSLQANQNQNLQVQSAQILHKQERHEEEKVPVQAVAQERIIQPSINEKPVHTQLEKMETKQSIEKDTEEGAMSRPKADIGVVFCRNCDQSYLSNEASCPKCNTAR